MTAEKKEAPEKKKEPFNVSEGGRKVLESMPAEMRDAFEGIITTADPTMRMMLIILVEVLKTSAGQDEMLHQQDRVLRHMRKGLNRSYENECL